MCAAIMCLVGTEETSHWDQFSPSLLMTLGTMASHKCMTQHDPSVDVGNRGGNQYLCVGTSIADYMLLAALNIPPVEAGRHTG